MNLAEFRQSYPQYNDMSDAALADALHQKFYSDVPREQFNQQIGFRPVGLVEAVGETFASPPRGPSILGGLKAAKEFFEAPKMAMEGAFSPQPVTPGVLTEEDVLRQDAAKAEEERRGRAGAATLVAGQLPGGIFGAPRGSLGMGFSRPGAAPSGTPVPTPAARPTPAPAQVVEAAERINVPVPRFLVDEGRVTQGLAAGLQNIPGAGDKIAKATETTTRALGSAADAVREGFGTGSASVAGSYAKDALTDWVGPGSKAIAERVYGRVDGLINPSVTSELRQTLQAAQTILQRRSNAKIPGESGAVKTILDAATTPGGLNYQGIKDLRSFLGEMTPEEIISQGLKGSEVKQLYGALTKDLQMAVRRAGGTQALAAWLRANRIFEQIVLRRSEISKVIGIKGDASPEAVAARLVAMAGTKSSADLSRLSIARRAMGAEAWNEVASSVVSKMGRDPQGEFSIQRFLTAYGNLSDAGRNTLFRSTGKDNHARALDDLNFVSKNLNDKIEQFRNPSGTGRSVVATGTVMGILHHPIKTLSTIIGGDRLATVLAEPASARALADWSKAYRDAIVAPHAGSSKAVKDAADKLAGHITRQHGGDAAALAAQLQFNAQLNQAAAVGETNLP